MSSPQKIGTITIASGQTQSNWLTKADFGRCRSLSIQCTAAALTGVCTVRTNTAEDQTGTSTSVQSPPGTDVTCAALKTVVLTGVPFAALSILSGAAEGGTRVFEVWGEVGE
jgi:hypothetical protein